MLHRPSDEDFTFLDDFEAGKVSPTGFGHAEHLRVAYCLLSSCDFETAQRRMRIALLSFLQCTGRDCSAYHETLTRAWLMAVRHFMAQCSSNSAAEFVRRCPDLMDRHIIERHYSRERLQSEDARLRFLEPDLERIPV
jgi:hypothetical protein